ncbi:MAG: cupredoxin domain-containing protein [Actinobacteria bacterium]|nr:cupredoxin domain-containing protein [Actinomycetota bacterium]
MRRLTVLPILALSLALGGSALAGSVGTANAVDITVANGSLHYTQTQFTAKPGLVRINFTNNSAAPHNVSLEHNGEFEYGATLTISKSTTTTFLTLAKGTYHVYSSVGKDEDKGMAATLVVK